MTTPTLLPQPNLPIDALETVYDQLAQAIDQAASQDRSELFLTKLALLSANALGDGAQFQRLIEAALRDL